MTALFIIGYLLGFIACYFLIKYKYTGTWTKGDRKAALKCSFYSWWGFAILLIVFIYIYFDDGSKDDEPANW